MKNFTIIADDFGLATRINDGIIDCAKESLIHGTALLVNAPATEEAYARLDEVKNIQVGLHLSLVEGYTLTGNKTLRDPENYFSGKPCLHRDWKNFAKLYLSGKISRKELEEEFKAQIETFIKNVGPIPFLNGTQHLHMLPGIFSLVVELCKKYQIPKIRTSSVPMSELMFTKQKLVGSLAMSACSLMSSKVDSFGITYGVSVSGGIDEKFIDFFLSDLGTAPAELVIHPGYNDNGLKELLPVSYDHFDWELELRALRYLKGKIS